MIKNAIEELTALKIADVEKRGELSGIYSLLPPVPPNSQANSSDYSFPFLQHF